MVPCTFLWKSRLSGVICCFVPLVSIGSPIRNGLGPGAPSMGPRASKPMVLYITHPSQGFEWDLGPWRPFYGTEAHNLGIVGIVFSARVLGEVARVNRSHRSQSPISRPGVWIPRGPPMGRQD
ncbi:hypothetical protein NPIL_213561 [Nephila pilipes]|uniref:Secreted protein n=1 Tax=Nephila pilipes TaxID=299642 RepID=A0A8X6IRG9_NEPPI|nr:hypothetical protein NPIL_213561 [Nephila pilipes]